MLNKKHTREKSHTKWEKLRKKKDIEINYTDSPATIKAFWKEAEVVMPHQKVAISVRFDDDAAKF